MFPPHTGLQRLKQITPVHSPFLPHTLRQNPMAVHPLQCRPVLPEHLKSLECWRNNADNEPSHLHSCEGMKSYWLKQC